MPELIGWHGAANQLIPSPSSCLLPIGRLIGRLIGRAHLQQAVAHQRDQQGAAGVAAASHHHGGILCGVHAGEVEHGHVGAAVLVHGEVKAGQPTARGEVGGLPRVRLQCILVHVGAGEEELRVCVVLAVRGEDIYARC